MRHISDGHEIRPRGGLLLVTTLHFYLYRYFPIAIDSIDQRAFISREKEKRGGESRRMLASPADMSAPLVRFGSVSRQETVAGNSGNAKQPRNRPRTAPAQDQPSTPREG